MGRKLNRAEDSLYDKSLTSETKEAESFNSASKSPDRSLHDIFSDKSTRRSLRILIVPEKDHPLPNLIFGLISRFAV